MLADSEPDIGADPLKRSRASTREYTRVHASTREYTAANPRTASISHGRSLIEIFM